MKRITIFAILLLLMLTLMAENPLFGGKATPLKQKTKIDSVHSKNEHPSFIGNIKITMLRWQRELYQKIYKQKDYLNNPAGFIVLLLIAFSYGFLHAMGPGHGKLFLTGYFFSNRSSFQRSILGGLVIGTLHALSGTIIVFILYFILHLPVYSTTDSLRDTLLIISYSLLLLLGIYFLFKAIKGHKHENTSFWGLVLSVGLIPCPGAVMLSLFGITILNSVLQTIIMIFCMGLGMSLAISMFSMLPTLIQQIKLPLLQKPLFNKALSIAGASLITVFALLLLLTAL